MSLQWVRCRYKKAQDQNRYTPHDVILHCLKCCKEDKNKKQEKLFSVLTRGTANYEKVRGGTADTLTTFYNLNKRVTVSLRFEIGIK